MRSVQLHAIQPRFPGASRGLRKGSDGPLDLLFARDMRLVFPVGADPGRR